MSSESDDSSRDEAEVLQTKKRRIPRACDACRRKKVKCDSAVRLGNACSNCVESKIDCTHNMPTKKRRAISKVYVEVLELRKRKLEELLRKFNPGMDIDAELNGGRSGPTDAFSNGRAAPSAPSGVALAADFDAYAMHKEPEFVRLPELTCHSLFVAHPQARANMRYFGKGSSVALMNSALDKLQHFLGVQDTDGRVRGSLRPRFWESSFWRYMEDDYLGPLTLLDSPDMLPARRRRLNCPPFDFPPPDLTAALVELYFACVNPVFPVLQRTKFDQRLQEGLHLRDRWFGATLLMVCALGARFSADPRTLLDGCEDWLSAGYRWFRQVPWLQLRLYRPASLYEVQTYELMTIYVLCSSTPQVAWTLLGIACRYAVELGLHRRDGREQMPLELEWQRAFWVLVALDRLIATFLGHPTTFQCEDVDVDLPIDTEDDTCRLGGERVLAHVPPSACLTTEYMSCFIRLTDVLDATLRSFYWKASKYQEMTGCSGPEWEQRTVSTLDSALNEWVDSIPEYLRWDPDMKDYTLFQQSCALYSVYYYTQIQVHRPFITKNNPLYPASISVCAHAARSHAHIVAAQLRRHQVVALPQIVIITFNVGIILLIQIWRKKKNSDVVEDMSSVRQDVQSCLDFLKECELVWQLPGRFWDILHGLFIMDDCPSDRMDCSNAKLDNAEAERRDEKPPNVVYDVDFAAHFVDVATEIPGSWWTNQDPASSPGLSALFNHVEATWNPATALDMANTIVDERNNDFGATTDPHQPADVFTDYLVTNPTDFFLQADGGEAAHH